jgi:hypothetical protein
MAWLLRWRTMQKLNWSEILRKANIPEPPWDDDTKHESVVVELQLDSEEKKDNWMQL